ncbi:MAG: hypothetical protein MJZ64_03480 [Paludibacteraceae bacterium]|nr:hypothetical protein [Paludibacteraceae bacterium]
MGTTSIIILVVSVIALIFLGLLGMQHMTYRQEEKKRLFELKSESRKAISPLRLRAYERLSLLLERTEPEAMLKEMMDDPGWINKSITDIQRELLQRIRLEFDHNMSQQIYVSDELWDRIMLARDEMAAFVNQMAIQIKPGSTGLDYMKVLIQAYHQNGDTPHEIALHDLKHEAHSLL